MLILLEPTRRLAGMALFATALTVALILVAAPAAAQTQPATKPAAKPADGKSPGAKPKAGAAATDDTAADGATADDAEALAARYRVPDTKNVDDLMAFIESVRKYQPRDVQSYMIHRKQAPRAVREAAEKVMALEKDKKSENYTSASTLVLVAQLSMLDDMTPVELKTLVDTVKKRLAVTRPPEQDLYLGMQLAQGLEETPHSALAADAYASVAKALIASGDPKLADAAKVLEAAARRLSLIGKPMEVFGQTMDGKPLDWKAYRGKVVLVDFWFTGCPPCRDELPNVKRLYKLYHDRGFDVVGISVDESREELETFLHEEQVPWTNIFDSKGQDEHPMAEHYGVMSFPTVILVGKDGKVVSFDARGEQLEEWLTKLLGPAGEPPAQPKNAKGPAKRAS
jgi:thiol-disulfide isomerase/thioredoxin